MPQIIECVPNFSEGRDKALIEAIVKEIESTEGVKLLDVDPGAATNRTVVTFIGTPEGVKEAAFKSIKKAAELIDMRKHHGAHPRIGATDVCPFVPVSGVTMEDCVRIANELGERVAEELGIPVYLYEEAAKRPERRNLATIREGEYEGLAEKLKDPNWAPDYGEARFNPKSGATVIGAREFLIAYNVNLNTRDRKLAHEIALNIRERGRLKRDRDGNVVRDANGNPIRVPGKLKAVKAVGWYIEEYGRAQVSINLTNYRITPLHAVFEEVRREAEKLGLIVTGSEVVGLIPLKAMLDAGRYFLEKQGKSPGVPEEELVQTAIFSLGLNDVAEFDPQKKIIEYQFEDKKSSWAQSPLRRFVNELSMDSPTPGGGSTAALSGSLASALTSMVANLTVGKKGYDEVWGEMKGVAIQAQELKDWLLSAVDKDAEAFDKVMEAWSLPKATEEQKIQRNKAIQEATKGAALVPLEVMRRSVKVLELAKRVAQKGNLNSVSDAGVSAVMACSAAEGASLNVRINLSSMGDKDFVERTSSEADSLLRQAKALKEEIWEIVKNRIG